LQITERRKAILKFLGGVVQNLSESFGKVASRVHDLCSAKSIHGVFVMGDLRTNEIRYALIDLATSIRIGVPEKRDLNFLGVALQKFTVVATYLMNSGNGIGEDVIGEVPWEGGVIGSTREFAYVFSGAESEVDRDLMIAARSLHESL
jgi:hypothetical protein